MIFPEHTDALSGPADATLNLRLSPGPDSAPWPRYTRTWGLTRVNRPFSSSGVG